MFQYLLFLSAGGGGGILWALQQRWRGRGSVAGCGGDAWTRVVDVALDCCQTLGIAISKPGTAKSSPAVMKVWSVGVGPRAMLLRGLCGLEART
jgi:hypothetical protein